MELGPADYFEYEIHDGTKRQGRTNESWRKELGLVASPKCCGCCLPGGICGACVEYNYGSVNAYFAGGPIIKHDDPNTGNTI
jgi:hypothetical protein